MTLEPAPLRNAAYKHTEDMEKLQHLTKGTQKNILSGYHDLAAHMESRLGREPMTSDVSYEMLEDYFREVVSAQTHGTHQTKRARCIVIVRWLMKRGYLEWGPNFAEDIPVRKGDTVTTRKRRFSDTELLKFLAAAKRSHARDYYLSLFLRLTGRRISEVIGHSSFGLQGLVWGDVRWDEGVIYWNNYKARTFGLRMPLTPRLRAVLEAWKAAYCEDFGLAEPRSDWYIFPALTAVGPVAKGRKRPRVVSPEYMFTNSDKAFRDIMKAAGLGHRLGDGWHVLRKTFGNQRKRAAVEGGRADAKELTKNALGHASEETQRIYLDEDEEYDRYEVWANATPEMGTDAMAQIPELAAFAEAVPETQQATPTNGAGQITELDEPEQVSSDVIDFATARKRRLLA